MLLPKIQSKMVKCYLCITSFHFIDSGGYWEQKYGAEGRGAINFLWLLISFSMKRGAAGYEFLNFKDFNPDGDYTRSLNEGLIGRIGIEAVFILVGNYMWGYQYNSSTMIRSILAWSKRFYDVICSRNAVVLAGPNEAEYERLAASERHLWKIIEK